MGQCESSDTNLTAEEKETRKTEVESTKKIDQELKQARNDDENTLKVLLLGAGESGKSTFFKQTIAIYGKGFGAKEVSEYKGIIFSNIISSMKMLCDNSEKYGPVNQAVEASKKFITELKNTEILSNEIVRHLSSLWIDEGIQQTYNSRSKFQLPDSTAYFYSRLNEISAPTYNPTTQDILRSRKMTMGVQETEFTLNTTKFRLVDVGGQRSMRKRWIACFDGVTALLFVAAVSEYDQVLAEDQTCNRVVEAITLFGEVINSRWFDKSCIILFLNKRDLFAEKITRVPLSNTFPEFKGDNTYESGGEFLKIQFMARNRKNRRIYTHVTCATDTSQVQVVFHSVTDTIIRQRLQAAGVMPE